MCLGFTSSDFKPFSRILRDLLSVLYCRYVSWGEYSLSFAAVLGQEECYRLILSRGADHDLVDSNGNSVTHILVVHDNMVRILSFKTVLKRIVLCLYFERVYGNLRE